MKLYVDENIWSESVVLTYKKGIFSRDLIVITLLFVLVIVEMPIILLLIRKFSESSKEFLLLATAMVAFMLGIFLLVFLSAPAKLSLIKITKADRTLYLGWIKNFIFRSKESVLFENIKAMNISVYTIKDENRIKMEIEKTSGEKIISVFSIESLENILTLFLNMAIIIDFQSYTAYRGSYGYRVRFSKAFDEKRRINKNLRDLVFESQDYIEKEAIKIPNTIIKELNPLKIIIYRKPNLYDIMRLVTVFIVFPFILFLSFMPKEPQKYIAVIVAIFAYLFTFYFMRRFLSPMKTVIDKLRGVVKVRRFIFSMTFPISQITQIEISDQIIKRIGTFIFHLDAILKNNRRHQLFYSEFSYKREKIYEVYENIIFLGENISKNLEVPLVNKTKYI
ncbi:MAG: hypothetical protein NZ809_05010 [Thermodesulfovibrio sp.]|nr:hypothetical protein [Thermodesulfovibrio sp.]